MFLVFCQISGLRSSKFVLKKSLFQLYKNHITPIHVTVRKEMVVCYKGSRGTWYLNKVSVFSI